jgi:outer membrane protein TolC
MRKNFKRRCVNSRKSLKRLPFNPRRWPSALACALAVSFLSNAARAETALTFQDSLRIAAQNNPDLQAALAESQARRAEYFGSYNGALPQAVLSHSVSTTRGDLRTWDAQASVSWDVINLSAWAAISRASAAERAGRAALWLAASQTLLDLHTAFSGLLYAQDQQRVNQDIRDLWKTDADMIELRYESGRESKGNKMRTDAQLLQADAEVRQAARDLRTAQQRLAQVLGQDRFSALQATGTWTSSALPPEPPDLEAIIDRTPRVLAQMAGVDQARAAIWSARSAFFPTLSLNYNRGYNGTTEFPTNPYWSAGARVSYALFGGGPTSAYFNASAASRAFERSQAELRSIRNQTRTDLLSAWAAFAEAHDQVRVQESFLTAARQRRVEADVRYQNGLMSYEEWQIVVVDLVNYEKSVLRSRQNLVLAEARWRFVQGEQLAG